jgi:hypothetical protein
MRLLILAALAALPAASAPGQPNQYAKAREAVRADCPRPPGQQYALNPGEPLKPRKLGELPPAEGYQAVLRTDGKGCLDPLLVKDRLRQSR